MLKFLFGQKDAKSVQKSQRDVITTLLSDLNDMILAMPEKPTITVNPNTGEISFALPDQMPDEALALPAPTDAEIAAADDSATQEDEKKAA